MSRIKAVFIFFLSFLIIFPTLQIKKADAAPRIEYLGQARYGIYEVGKFRVDGKLAFCIDHYKQSPPTGTSYSPGRIYSNESVRAILHYGAGGPEAIVGTNDVGIVATTLALDSVVNGNHSSGRNSIPGYKELMAHAEAKDAPSDNIDFSKYSLNSSVSGNRQISERVTFEADSRNSIRIPVPQNVTLHIVGGGSYTNRTVTIKGGQTFYFSAGLDYGNTVQLKNLKPAIGAYQSILFVPQSNGFQRLAHGYAEDPPVMKTLTVKFQKRQQTITVNHRDKYDNRLLQSSQYKRDIGSSYSFTPLSKIVSGGNTFIPVANQKASGTVPNRDITINFYYNLERTITVLHKDARTDQLIKSEKYTKYRGDKYSFSPRTDLKKGEFKYRPVSTAKKTGTVGSQNITLTFYYDVPLIKVGMEKIQIYTAPASKGLPVKVTLSKQNIYPSSVADMATAPVNIGLYQGSKQIVSKKYTAKTLPKSLELTIPKDQLNVNTHKPYTIKFEGYNSNNVSVIQNAGSLTTEGYTSAEQTITSNASKNVTYKGVVMTEREVGKSMKTYYETFTLKPKKLDKMRTGYGFEMPMEFTYENEIGNSSTSFSFDMNVPESLVDKSYLSYPVKNKIATVPFDKTYESTNKNGQKVTTTQKFELPHVNVEEKTGHLFSDKQVQNRDSRIKDKLIDGGRNFYLPIWGHVGNYPISVESEDIGINQMNIDVSQDLNVFAHFYTHIDSSTVADDAILLEPINKDDPFPNGVPSGWTSKEVQELKKMLNRELDKGNLKVPAIFSNIFK